MGPQKLIAGIVGVLEVENAADRVVSRLLRNARAERIRFQFKPFGKASRPHGSANVCHGFDPAGVQSRNRAEDSAEDGTGLGRRLCLRDMAFDMVGRFMADHKGNLIAVAQIPDQGRGDGKDWTARLVVSLVRVGAELLVIVDDELEIAVGTVRACPARPFCDRFDAGGNGPVIADCLWASRSCHFGKRRFWCVDCGAGHLAGCEEWHKSKGKEAVHLHIRQAFVRADIIAAMLRRFNSFMRDRRRVALVKRLRLGQTSEMFTIEHEFDATVVTLVDEGASFLQEDVAVTAFEDCIVIEQSDREGDGVQKITLSLAQLSDLKEALNLPEGVYKRRE